VQRELGFTEEKSQACVLTVTITQLATQIAPKVVEEATTKIGSTIPANNPSCNFMAPTEETVDLKNENSEN
jgi:hypothetical protein